MPVTPTGRLVPRKALLLALLVAGTACGSSDPEGLIERDAFVDAYVELRIAALDTDSSRIAAADRDAILQRLGITEDDLLEFVRVHAGELEYMRDVWNDVELRLDRAPERRADQGS